jgi:hypothetical protein
LRVGVVVNVELDTLGRLDLLNKGREGLELDGIARSSAFVVLGTGVGRGASRDIPHIVPVAVDVATDARAARVGLTVLSPQAIGALGIQES